MKKILQYANISTPAFHTKTSDIKGLEDIDWIVKSDTEHASVGLDASSVVKGLEKALLLMKEKENHYGGDWFVEDYIDGREFNLGMFGPGNKRPKFLSPAEIIFTGYPRESAKIVDYSAKWDENSFAYKATKRQYLFDSGDQILINKMKRISLDCWKLFGLSGAVRIDFRIDENSQPWIIDINANPCLSSDAGFMAAASRDGISLQDILLELLHSERCHVSN